jgi:ribosomal protein S18 acetylase RimI-like enzyme
VASADRRRRAGYRHPPDDVEQVSVVDQPLPGPRRPRCPADHLALATEDEADELLALRDGLGRWMMARGIDQWRPGEFPGTTLLAWIAAGWVHVDRREHGLVGAVAVLPEDPDFWGSRGTDGTAGYVHLLMVRRDHHGAGIGDALLRGAERHIAATGRRLVRLDAASGNAALSRWYDGRGYLEVDRVELPGLGSTTLRAKSLDTRARSPAPA